MKVATGGVRGEVKQARRVEDSEKSSHLEYRLGPGNLFQWCARLGLVSVGRHGQVPRAVDRKYHPLLSVLRSGAIVWLTNNSWLYIGKEAYLYVS